MKIQSASLDAIAIANDLPTGDELRAHRREITAERTRTEIAALPKYMNSKQRRALRKTLAKGNLEILEETA